MFGFIDNLVNIENAVDHPKIEKARTFVSTIVNNVRDKFKAAKDALVKRKNKLTAGLALVNAASAVSNALKNTEGIRKSVVLWTAALRYVIQERKHLMGVIMKEVRKNTPKLAQPIAVGLSYVYLVYVFKRIMCEANLYARNINSKDMLILFTEEMEERDAAKKAKSATFMEDMADAAKKSYDRQQSSKVEQFWQVA